MRLRFFESFFALDCKFNVIELLEMDQSMHSIPPGEPVDRFSAVLVDSGGQDRL